MKKLIFLLFIILCSYSFAQIQSFDSTHIEGLKNDLVGTYKEIVKQSITMTGEQSKIFWPLFDDYMKARNPIFEERVSVTEEYMLNYYSLDDETGKNILNRAMQLSQELLDVRKEYINKMMEQLPVPVVGKFFQVDNRVTIALDMIRMSSTPLVREEER